MTSSKFQHPFGKAAKKFREFRRELPDDISTMAENDFKENFERQGYINKNGVLIPWRKIKAVKKKKKGILIQTGKLKRSLRKAPTYDAARVVTNVDYAEAHNEGFKGTVQIKAHKRKGKDVKAHKRKMNMPRRAFMITSKKLTDEIDDFITKELNKIL